MVPSRATIASSTMRSPCGCLRSTPIRIRQRMQLGNSAVIRQFPLQRPFEI